MIEMLFGVSVDIPEEVREHTEEVLSNNNTLNDHIMEMNEYDLVGAIVVEKSSKRRAYILNRLYSRFSELRKHRERLELYR